MLNLEIQISGCNEDDLSATLQEIAGLVSKGFVSSQASGEAGSYTFSVTGEESEQEEEE